MGRRAREARGRRAEPQELVWVVQGGPASRGRCRAGEWVLPGF